jgi:hypothetical protein
MLGLPALSTLCLPGSALPSSLQPADGGMPDTTLHYTKWGGVRVDNVLVTETGLHGTMTQDFTPSATCQAQCNTHREDWAEKCKWNQLMHCDGCVQCEGVNTKAPAASGTAKQQQQQPSTSTSNSSHPARPSFGFVVLVVGTMRGFCHTLAPLRDGVVAPNGDGRFASTQLFLSTYVDQDCGGGLDGAATLNRGQTVAADGLSALYRRVALPLAGVSVLPFHDADVALPEEWSFGGAGKRAGKDIDGHGLLERYYSQFRLRHVALELFDRVTSPAGSRKPANTAANARGPDPFVLLTRADVMLTSTWELEPDDADAGGGAGGAGWSLVVTLKALPDGTQAKTERYRLGPDTVVVPKSNVHHMDIADGAIMTDDTLVVGRLSAVRKYVALFDRLREGAYNLTGGHVNEHATGMTIPLTQYPEGLLLYHMQQEGLDVQRTFFRSELLQLVRRCAPWDEEVQEGDSAASVSAAAMTARVHAEGRYCPQGLVPPPATAANRTADVGANTAAATGVPEGFTPTATCQTECHTYAGDWKEGPDPKCSWNNSEGNGFHCEGCEQCTGVAAAPVADNSTNATATELEKENAELKKKLEAAEKASKNASQPKN